MNTIDHNLHELAGLIPAGIDLEGDQQWLGTTKQWKRYESLADKDILEQKKILSAEEELSLEAQNEEFEAKQKANRNINDKP